MTGKVVYTFVDGAYRLVCNVGSELWADMRSWVGSNYDEGENTEISTEQVYPSGSSYVYYDMTSQLNWHYSSYGTYYYYRMTLSGSTVIYQQKTNEGTWTNNSNMNVLVPAGGRAGYGIKNGYINCGAWDSSNVWHSKFAAEFEVCSVSISLSTGLTGTTGIVDNPNHDFVNVGTGSRDIGIELSLAALESGAYGFDLPTLYYTDMAGLDYTDIEAQDLAGTAVINMGDVVEA